MNPWNKKLSDLDENSRSNRSIKLIEKFDREIDLKLKLKPN